MERRGRGKPVVHPKVRNCETDEIFETYTEAAESVGGSRYGVMKTCWGIQRVHHGVRFEFIEEEEKDEH